MAARGVSRRRLIADRAQRPRAARAVVVVNHVRPTDREFRGRNGVFGLVQQPRHARRTTKPQRHRFRVRLLDLRPLGKAQFRQKRKSRF